jgi:cell division protein FtsQ
MSRKTRGTRRSSILKRRSSQADWIIYWSRRIGIYGGLIVFVLWVGAWLVLSGTAQRSVHTAYNKAIEQAGKAGFSVQNILVEGRIYTDAETIRAITNLQKGDPIFAFDPQEAQNMLEKLSWVRSVHVERRLPDTVYIGLTERRPLALWQRQKRLSLIDADGIVLTDHKLERFKELIVVTGKDVPQRTAALIALLSAEPEIKKHVEAAALIGGRRWDLTLKSGAVVKLPEQEMEFALRRLAVMHEQEELLTKNVKTIDVREDSRMTVRTHPGAVQEYKAGYHASGNI